MNIIVPQPFPPANPPLLPRFLPFSLGESPFDGEVRGDGVRRQGGLPLKAAILTAPGRIEVREIPRPVAGPGEVVIRVRAALTCGTDLKAYLRGHPYIPMPGPFGHEYAGDVVETGPGVQDFSPGDPVMGVHSAPCQVCYWCRRNQGNLCPHVMETKVLGAFAEYLLLPGHIVRQNLFVKPPSLSYEEAALLEPLSCVVYALQQVPVDPADTVLIVGAGPIALLFASALYARGVERILIAGRRAVRLQAARALGFARVLNAERDDVTAALAAATDGRGADLVVEATGRVDVWEQTVDAVRRGGHVVLFGGPPAGTRVTFDTHRVHYDQITLHSPFHFTPEAVVAARDLLLGGRLVTAPLLTERLPLDRTPEAFQRLAAGEGMKFILTPEGSE